jgi:DNA-binding NarL/FixJ family response regulator
MQKNSTSAKARTRVLIADDYLPFAERCRSMLEPEFEVVGIALDGFRLEERIVELKPDVVVIDVSMPEMNGFDAGERVGATRPGAKTIYMTVAGDFRSATEAFQRGASGFVDKARFPEELRIAVRRAVRGELQLSASLLTEVREMGSFHLFIEGRSEGRQRT